MAIDKKRISFLCAFAALVVAASVCLSGCAAADTENPESTAASDAIASDAVVSEPDVTEDPATDETTASEETAVTTVATEPELSPAELPEESDEEAEELANKILEDMSDELSDAIGLVGLMHAAPYSSDDPDADAIEYDDGRIFISLKDGYSTIDEFMTVLRRVYTEDRCERIYEKCFEDPYCTFVISDGKIYQELADYGSLFVFELPVAAAQKTGEDTLAAYVLQETDSGASCYRIDLKIEDGEWKIDRLVDERGIERYN